MNIVRQRHSWCLTAAALLFAACGYGDSSPQGRPLDVAATSFALSPTVPQNGNNFALFETLQVRPLALSPNKQKLFALNTPDNRLEIFQITNSTNGSLNLIASVAVGLEPIAVAARSNSEVWVVNHLSDSVSIVKVAGADSRVVRTLHVGDEPRDIVFGGLTRNLAFITTAHRGQNSGEDPELFDPSVGRADVWVFDAGNLGNSMGGDRLTKLTLFADTPRALAVSADGSRVYAAPFFSGNQTTIASKEVVANTYGGVDPDNPFFMDVIVAPDQPPVRQPITSRVVKLRNGPEGVHWYDDLDTNFDSAVRVTLPDYDVFTIDATQYPPTALADQTFAHAGTTIFNMAANPNNGKIYIANTEAHNDTRFEGHGEQIGVTTVRGNLVDSRITVLDPSDGSMTYANLNSHIVDGVGDAGLSRAFPQDMAVSEDGSMLMVVAQGSAKVGVYQTAALEAGVATPTASNQILLSAGGPAGIAYDDSTQRAFVLTRFDNGISILDIPSRAEVGHTQMRNPEPIAVIEGRRFLYDATYTSETGTQACASCHIGGDFDGLSWDLGNPGGIPLMISQNGNPNEMFTIPPAFLAGVPGATELFSAYQPVKGPMTTQSMRGLDNHGGMHWRGDRNGAIMQDGTPFLDENDNPVVSAQPDSGIFNEFAAFFSFNVAFPGLVGRAAELPVEEMAAFTEFALKISYPPNPIRALDNSLNEQQAMGSAIYHQTQTVEINGVPTEVELPVDRIHNCNGCHVLDPNGNEGQTDHPGFFGSNGRLSFENLPHVFKVAHLRNAYQKIGMFASTPDSNRTFTVSPYLNPPLTAVRGFGFQPDGAVGQIQHHISGRVFVRTTNASSPVGANPGGLPHFLLDQNGDPLPIPDPQGYVVRDAIASFLMAYDSNFKPIVGQQLTLDGNDGGAAADRLALLAARASVGECDLVVKAWDGSRQKGYVYQSGKYTSDVSAEAPIDESALLATLDQEGGRLTFTCVPPGSGFRIGIDRDADGYSDGDELALGTDPSSAASHP